jgi:protein-tyrosine phosphatase
VIDDGSRSVVSVNRQFSVHRVLFVCTGNIFRSLTAEYALRNVLGAGTDLIVASAGTENFPHVVSPFVREYLFARGIDVSGHRRRTLTDHLLEKPGLVVAMSTEHRSFLAQRFNRPDVPLFTEACGLPSEPLPDVEEAVADHKTNPAAVEAHMQRIIDRIIELSPHLAQRLMRTTSQIPNLYKPSRYSKT